MNLTLWIVAGLLAALSMFSGATKVFWPKSKLDESTDWTESTSAGFVRTLGVLEFLAAAGLRFAAVTQLFGTSGMCRSHRRPGSQGCSDGG
ncbi:DoxX family protein [Nocardia brasiliensis]|uniref:DoxX family protein n=1 Tax=Nocardia brasiliensis TaxID=37326 RepID=UPI0006925EA5|nr:DoxX family protein [Nocardia brasiliensis]